MKHPLTIARKTAGLSQKVLAHEVSCDRVTIARIESGAQSPSLAMVARIAAALRKYDVELSADEFLPLTADEQAGAA